MNIKKSAFSSLLWVGLSSLFVRISNYLTKIVLARLLLPEDFGLVAIGFLAINSIALFRDFGFGAALIYKDEKDTIASTMFFFLPLVASILYLISYLISPFISSYYQNPEINSIVRFMALTLIISSFGTVPTLLLEKNLKFKKMFFPDVLPVLGYASLSIFLALNGYGVWSLVYGQIFSSFISLVVIWFVSEWRPKLYFSISDVRDLFNYGKHVFMAQILFFIIANIDDGILGKMLGMQALGIYTIAYTISNLPATHITFLVNRVMFPVYSMIKEDTTSLKKAYLETLKYISMLSIPAAVGIFSVSSFFVQVILGSEWMDSIVPIQLLSIYGLSRSLVGNMGPLRNGIGRPDITMKLAFLQIMMFLLIFYPLVTSKGIEGMCLAVVLSALLLHSISFLINHIIFKINILDVLKILSPFIACSLAMMYFLSFIESYMPRTVFGLFTLITCGIFFYSLLCLIFFRKSLANLIQMLSSRTSKDY